MMPQEEETVNQRLNLIVDTFERGVKSAFAQKIGISPQGAHDLLSGRKGAPSFKALSGILENYPQVRSEWLVLGRGPMLERDGPELIHKAIASALSNLDNTLVQLSAEFGEGNTLTDVRMQLTMANLSLKDISARLHGEDVEHPNILKARADAEQHALSRIYSVAEDYPRGPGSQLSVRLDVSEATAKQLVASGKIRAVDVGEGYRTSEQAVRDFLKQTVGSLHPQSSSQPPRMPGATIADPKPRYIQDLL